MGFFPSLVGGVEIRERPKRYAGEPTYKRLDFVRPKEAIDDYQLVKTIYRDRASRDENDDDDPIIDVVAERAEPDPPRLTFQQWQHATLEMNRQRHEHAMREQQRLLRQQQEQQRLQQEQDLFWRLQAEQGGHPQHNGHHPQHNGHHPQHNGHHPQQQGHHPQQQNRIPPPPPFAPGHGPHPGAPRNHGHPNHPQQRHPQRPQIEPQPEIIQIFNDDDSSDDDDAIMQEIRPRGGGNACRRAYQDDIYSSDEEDPRPHFSRSRSRHSRASGRGYHH